MLIMAYGAEISEDEKSSQLVRVEERKIAYGEGMRYSINEIYFYLLTLHMSSANI